jgi:hypothetical protein
MLTSSPKFQRWLNIIVGKANYGVVFAIVKQQKGWTKVKHESGLVG